MSFSGLNSGSNSSFALLKYDVNPNIRRLNKSLFTMLPLAGLINNLLNPANVSGSALFFSTFTAPAFILILFFDNVSSNFLINSFSLTLFFSPIATPLYSRDLSNFVSNVNGFLVILSILVVGL